MTRVYVLHPDLKIQSEGRDPEQALAEAVSLTEAIDLDVVGAEVAPLAKPRAGWLFGSGRIEALKAKFAAAEIDLVVIDGPLTPVQQRNLEREWKVKILDRTGLILEIFGERAATREGELQVELAHLEYQKTRLVRSWTHLERQRGGLGFVGGPGETQIEADRRALDERILRIKKQLSKVVKTRTLHRAARKRTPFPIVALVGYTNAGKSTLFNRLTASDVLAKDMLFATLDPTMRAIELPDGRKVILSDTVGFISGLPTQLVAAFRATLEEVLEADLILHVRDISHENTEAQNADVIDVLTQLGVSKDRLDAMLEVRNKLDLLDPSERLTALNEAARRDDVVAISALDGYGLPELMQMVTDQLGEQELELEAMLPFNAGEALAWLHANVNVLSVETGEEGNRVTVRAAPSKFGQFESRFGVKFAARDVKRAKAAE
jgi:GTP-binding protein HflX